MSILSRIFPFLFDEVAKPASALTPVTISTTNLLPQDKLQLIQNPKTPLPVLARLGREKDQDIQLLLAKRLATLIKKTKASDRETTALLLETIRQLTEESITPVRIALVSTLKDIAHCPPDLARKFADDIEREVAEPIIRYSLGLSDADLLDLISRHPQDWHTTTIAQRSYLSSDVSNAVIKTGNKQAGLALLDNDGAIIHLDALDLLGNNKDYARALQRRNALARKIKRDVFILAQRRVQELLRSHTQLDQKTTKNLIETVQRRIDIQDNEATINPATMSETAMKDALSVGNENLVIHAVALKAGTSDAVARRMLVDSGAAKPVISLCTKAGLTMGFAVLLQQRLTRLPPTKIIYAKNGTENPLSADEIQWQLEFFGITP